MKSPIVIERIMAEGQPLPTHIYVHPWGYLRRKHGQPMEQLHDRLVRRLKYPGGRKARAARLRLQLRRRP